jgi:Flp pilus assembly pilin Flp
MHVEHAMLLVLVSVLLAALFPGGGLCASACLQKCCSAAAGIAVLMHQQHCVHLAFAAIIADLHGVMSHQILPL